MHHFFEAITNTAGDSLIGYFARVIDRTTQNTVTLSSDDNGTPIVTVSGVENMAKSDSYGNLSLYVTPGTYHLDIYAPNTTSFLYRVSDVAMNSTKGDPGPQGEQGIAGEGLEDVMAPAGSALVGFTQAGTGAIQTTLQEEARRLVWAEQYGLKTTNTAAQNSTAILNAVTALRGASAILSTDGLNGGSFTAYSSGVLLIGPGVFPIAPDVLKFTQDLGLIIRGQGSRKTNLSVIGRTVLLVTGNGQFGIQVMGNGARGFVMEDLDLVYAGNTYTGDLFDNFGAPGVVVNRCHIGTHGTSGGTRFRSARSCVRTTYDEFEHFQDTTFDGAVDGWWSDDTRQPPVGGTNGFGGARTKFTNCVFYDFDGDMIRHDGNRNRLGMTINASFNPISFNCVRAIDLNNVDGLSVTGGNFSASVDSHASAEWIRLVNCTGKVSDNWLADFSNIGTFLGNLDISNNFFGGLSGLTLSGGVISGKGNEFSPSATAGSVGYTIAPTAPLTFELGPDVFKAGMGRSYDIPADSANLEGRITYSAVQDSSTNRFRNTSGRVSFTSVDKKAFPITASAYTVLPTDTGRIINMTGTAPVVTLPALANTIGCEFTIMSNTSEVLTIQGPAGTLYAGAGGVKTSMTSVGDSGLVVNIRNMASAYNVLYSRGGFNFA